MFFIPTMIKNLSHSRIKQPVFVLKKQKNSFTLLKEKITDGFMDKPVSFTVQEGFGEGKISGFYA